MLYSELVALTDNKATWKQYKAIEKIYMANENMTKKDAADLWKRLFSTSRKPIPKYLKMVKESIREFKGNREYLDALIAQKESEIDEKISEYDPANWTNEWIIQSLQDRKS